MSGRRFSDLGGRCQRWQGSRQKCVLPSAGRPQAPPSASPRAQRPEVWPWPGSPGAQGRVLTATHFQAPALARAPPSRRPAAPPPRSPAPRLPYLAQLCHAGRRARGPAGRAGRTRGRAPSPWPGAPRGGAAGGVAAPGRARGGGGGDWKAPRGGSGLRGGERGQARGGGPRGGPGYRTRRPASPAGSCSRRASAQSRSWDLRKGRGDVAPKHALSASFFLPCFLVSRAPSVFLRFSPPPPLSPPLLAPFRFFFLLPFPLPLLLLFSVLLLLHLLFRALFFFFFFQRGPRRGGRSPCAPGRAAPSPGCRAAACRNLQSGAGGAGPVSMETASPGAGRSGADRAQSMDQCKPPLRSRPNSTGAPARPLSRWGASGGVEGAPPALARQESRAEQVCMRTSAGRQKRAGGVGETGRAAPRNTEMGSHSGPSNVLRTFTPNSLPHSGHNPHSQI